MHKLTFSAIACLMLASTLFAANSNWTGKGRSVSIAYRGGTTLNWGNNANCPENIKQWGFGWRGSVVCFKIDGNNVSCDTLFSRTNGLASYPVFNIEGNKVAFYRSQVYLNASQSALLTGDTNYISLIDLSNNSVTNLCAVPDLAKVSADYSDNFAIAWPAGSWIYYIRPAGNNVLSKSIWRVHTGTKATELVSTLPATANARYRRFTMNLQGTRAGIQAPLLDGSDNYQNGACNWPPTSDGSLTGIGGIGSCNSAINCDGSMVSGYMQGGHDRVELAHIGGAQVPADSLPTVGMVQQWTSKTIDGQLISGGGEQIRWAINSAKWICQQYGWNGHAENEIYGGNQILINWIDKKAIVPSSNPKIAIDQTGANGTVYYCNDPGDFWVDGGQANFGKYEDSKGVWQSISGFTPSGSYISVTGSKVDKSLTSTKNTALNLKITFSKLGSLHATLFAPGRSTVRIADLHGRTVFSKSGLQELSIPSGMLKSGVYLISEQSGNKTESAKISIAR